MGSVEKRATPGEILQAMCLVCSARFRYRKKDECRHGCACSWPVLPSHISVVLSRRCKTATSISPHFLSTRWSASPRKSRDSCLRPSSSKSGSGTLLPISLGQHLHRLMTSFAQRSALSRPLIFAPTSLCGSFVIRAADAKCAVCFASLAVDVIVWGLKGDRAALRGCVGCLVVTRGRRIGSVVV